MPSVKELKNNAVKILSRDFMVHAGAFILPAVCFLAFIYTGITLADLIYGLAGEAAFSLAVYALLVFTVAMTVPLIYGYAVFQVNCLNNGKANISDMFCAFSSAKLYFRSFKVFYAMLWRFAIVFAVPLELINVFITYIHGEKDKKIIVGGYDLAYTLQVILIVISVSVAFLVFCRYTTALYITVTREEQSVSRCFFAAKIYLKNCGKRLCALAVSFVPLILLGIISCGIAFIYILPLIMTAFFLFSHERCNNNIISQQTIKMIFN